MDALPAWTRHLFLLVAPVALGWVASDVVPGLKDRSPLVATLASALVVAALAWLTPFTRQYGVGASANPARTSRELGSS